MKYRRAKCLNAHSHISGFLIINANGTPFSRRSILYIDHTITPRSAINNRLASQKQDIGMHACSRSRPCRLLCHSRACRLLRNGCLHTRASTSRLLRYGRWCFLLFSVLVLILLLAILHHRGPSSKLLYYAAFLNLRCCKVLQITIAVLDTVQPLPRYLASFNLLHNCVKLNPVDTSLDGHAQQGVALFFCWRHILQLLRLLLIWWCCLW